MENSPAFDEPRDLSSGEAGPSALAIAWRRKSLLILGAAVGLVLGALHYSQQVPMYQSAAEVLVVQKRPEEALPMSGMQAGMAYVEDYVTAQARIVRSPLIVERAVASGKAPAGYSVGGIVSSLSVNLEGNVLALSFRGPDPDECRQMLDAVITSYQDFLDETYKNVNEESLRQLTENVGKVREDLQDKERLYREFLKNKPLLGRGSEGASLYEQRLSAVDAQRSQLQIEKAKTSATLAAVRTAMENGEAPETLAILMEGITSEEDGPRGVSAAQSQEETLERELIPLLLKEQTLLENYGPDYPEVRLVRRQIEMTRDFHNRLGSLAQQEADATTDGNAHKKPGSLAEQYLASLEQRLKTIELTEKTLAALFEEQHREAKTVEDYDFEERQLSGEISRDEKFYEGLIAQLQGINLGKDLGGYTTSVIAPPAPGWRVAPSLSRTILAALMLGLMGGFGLAYVAEITDRSFRTPEEIRRRLGLPVMGQIPHIKVDPNLQPDPNGPPLAPVLYSYYRPQSHQAEAYRGVRTALYFSAGSEGHKVIQVTSPNQGDGKSTLTANLAVAIAKAGNRILLIDADLRRPRVHTLFGVSSETGLASVISGEVELAEATQESGVPGLWVLPSGPVPPNPAELLTSPRLAELLNLVRDQYDFVLVDTPPLLAVTDPSVVAPRVDGVLLTIRITKGGSVHAARAKDILDAVGAKVLGVVVNDKDRGGGGNRYGYGYGGYGGGYYGQAPYYRDGVETSEEPLRNGAVSRNGDPQAHVRLGA